MPLVLTIGGASANSYASVAEADAYIARTSYAAAWVDLETADKELLLQRACLELDKLPFIGAPVSDTQALQMPRYYMTRPTGGEYLSTEIPLCVKQAQCLLAGWIVNYATELDPFGGDDTAKLSSLVVGPIEMVFRRDSAVNASESFVHSSVWPILAAGMVVGTMGQSRLTR